MLAVLKIDLRRIAGVSLTAFLFLALSAPPASPQGVFETLLGGSKPTASDRGPQIAHAEPLLLSGPLLSTHAPESRAARGEGGGTAAAYCVRLCDGRYFPLARNSAVPAGEQCRAFCPTAKTKVFFGSSINHATAADGSRYANLDTALLHRTRIVNHCTCNGRDAFGVARMPIANDPTLRAGDIVAVNGGFSAYSGFRSATRAGLEFVPIEHSANVPSDVRRRLAATKVLPARQAEMQTNARYSVEGKTARRDDRRAQLSR